MRAPERQGGRRDETTKYLGEIKHEIQAVEEIKHRQSKQLTVNVRCTPPLHFPVESSVPKERRGVQRPPSIRGRCIKAVVVNGFLSCCYCCFPMAGALQRFILVCTGAH